jgi:hypothetical protein
MSEDIHYESTSDSTMTVTGSNDQHPQDPVDLPIRQDLRRADYLFLI